MTDSIQQIPNKELVMGKKLGEGGFGIVYKGSWAGEDVAIKTLRMTKLSSEMEKEFTGEASAMSKLNNPRIIRLYGICTEPGHYAMVMAFMPRGDLYELLSEKKQTLPWTLRWRLATDVGIGLSYLHGRQILHRDLKSLNILLDRDLRAKITDFGLAKLRQQTKSIYTNKIRGSLPWMAPELFARRPKLTDKADVYAYGMVLWEIASRKIPFSDAHDPSLIPTWVKDGEREDIPKDCPKAYAEVIERCWKGKPEERPTAASALKILQQARPNKKEDTSTNSLQNLSLTLKQVKIPPSQKKSSDVSAWQCLKTLTGHSKEVTSLALLSNKTLASGSADSTIKIWDLKTGTCLRTLKGHSYGVHALTALPKDRFAGGSNNMIKIWNAKSGICHKTITGHSDEVVALSVLKDGSLVSGYGYYPEIKIWNVQKGTCLKTLKGHSNGVKSLSVCRNGSLASASYDDSMIRVWNVKNGTLLKTLKGDSSLAIMSLSALEGNSLASGSRDGTIKIWDLKSGTCLTTLKGHSGGVTALTPLSNGRFASGSGDMAIKIWNLKSGTCLTTLKGHSSSVTSLIALPNGNIASGSPDKTIKIWKTPYRR